MFEVIVGNIGTVYSGNDHRKAVADFLDYKKQSKDGIGRAAGEPVTLLEDGEIINEYEGKKHELLSFPAK